ncbi:MAG TPA: hypothetical protein VK054_09585 [Beutenbergiaceae bacterium]|nr:hypothetical protein [Beutenbergiaceae bacterium]
MSTRAIAYAAAMTALLAVYTWLVGARAVVLMRTGEIVGIGIGLAALAIPLVVVWFTLKEWHQAHTVSRMYKHLEAEGGLIADNLARTPAGRVDKDRARSEFSRFAHEVETNPEDWRAWFHLGWAYDAAGDRPRARRALRQATRLFRQRG